MLSIPHPQSARDVKLSNPQHPYTPGHDVRVVIDAFRKIEFGNIIEIGCNLGWTTRELALAFPDRLIYAIDWPAAGQSMAAHQRGEAPDYHRSCEVARDLPNVLSIIADSRKLKTGWFKDVSCIFIDGDHSYAGVEADSHFAMLLRMERCLEDKESEESPKFCTAWHDCYEDAPAWVGVRKYLEDAGRDMIIPDVYQVQESWVAVQMTE